MLSQLKADLAKRENENSINDIILENVNMEAIKESYIDGVDDYELDSVDLDDVEAEALEKIINDLPEYTNESDMNIKLKRILENYIPDFDL
jgi:hypothetical protein